MKGAEGESATPTRRRVLKAAGGVAAGAGGLAGSARAKHSQPWVAEVRDDAPEIPTVTYRWSVNYGDICMVLGAGCAGALLGSGVGWINAPVVGTACLTAETSCVARGWLERMYHEKPEWIHFYEVPYWSPLRWATGFVISYIAIPDVADRGDWS